MKRVTVRLGEDEYEAAKQEAALLGISMSEVFRRSLRQLLTTYQERPWMRCAGMVASGDPGSSGGIDGVVYGGPK